MRDAESTSEIHAEMWKPHLAIAGGLCVVVLGVVWMPYTSDQPEFVQQLVEARGLVQSVVPGAEVSIQRGTTKASTSSTGQTSTSSILVGVAMRVKPENFEGLADQIAMAMFEPSFGIRDSGQVSIVVSYGYDIMISRVRTTKTFAHSPQEWLKRLKIDEPSSASPPA